MPKHAPVTNHMVRSMRRLSDQGLTYDAIAARMGLSKRTVIRHMKEHPSTKTTRRLDYGAIFYDLACRVPRKVIAQEHGVSLVHLSRIYTRYRHVYEDRANAQLREEARAAYMDGDTIGNISTWSGRNWNTVKGWVRDLMPKSERPSLRKAEHRV